MLFRSKECAAMSKEMKEPIEPLPQAMRRAMLGCFQAGAGAARGTRNVNRGRPLIAEESEQAAAQRAGGIPGEEPLAAGELFPGGNYKLPAKAKPAKQLWGCWLGKGAHEGIPAEGGAGKMEQLHGKKWRRHCKPSERKHFSRCRLPAGGMLRKKGGCTGRGQLMDAMNALLKHVSGFEKEMSKNKPSS